MAHQVVEQVDKRVSWRDERGANLLEFALVVPVLMLIVFGIIEFGVAYNNSLSLRAGAQEGARAGVVANFGPIGVTGTNCPLASVPVNATTEPTRRLMCLTKNRIGLNQPNVSLRVSFFTTGPSGPTGAYVVGDYIRICARYPLSSVSGFFAPLLNGRFQTVRAEMRIEQVVTPPLTAATEGNPPC